MPSPLVNRPRRFPFRSRTDAAPLTMSVKRSVPPKKLPTMPARPISFFEVEFKAAIEKFAERFGTLMNQPNTEANLAAMAKTNDWGKESRREVVRAVASTYGCRVLGES